MTSSMLGLRRFSYRQMASLAPDVFETSVTFKNSQGESIRLNAVYQDTLPSGSSVGTVIGLHGAPGSHNDFKYISPLLTKKSIRFIGVNYPGFGVTPNHELLKFNNVERHDFVSSLISQLDLKKNLVILGHSRGTENAIMLASEGKVFGIVLLNPTGLRKHRGIKPFWFIQACNRLYNTPIPRLKTVLHPLFFQLYKFVKLKVADGLMAANCLQTMESVALGDQKPYIKLVNGNETKVLFCYAGQDWLIESEISKDCAQAFNIDHLHSTTTEKKEEEELLTKTADSFQKKGCSVFFEADGHFLNKARADFVATAIDEMLKVPPLSKL